MKNYSEIIRSKAERTLTAKGNKFVWRCIDIIAASKGSNRYAPEMAELKKKFRDIVEYLLIDREMTIAQVIEDIKGSRYLGIENVDLNLTE